MLRVWYIRPRYATGMPVQQLACVVILERNACCMQTRKSVVSLDMQARLSRAIILKDSMLSKAARSGTVLLQGSVEL